jgi:hypothetical protein
VAEEAVLDDVREVGDRREVEAHEHDHLLARPGSRARSGKSNPPPERPEFALLVATPKKWSGGGAGPRLPRRGGTR